MKGAYDEKLKDLCALFYRIIPKSYRVLAHNIPGIAPSERTLDRHVRETLATRFMPESGRLLHTDSHVTLECMESVLSGVIRSFPFVKHSFSLAMASPLRWLRGHGCPIVPTTCCRNSWTGLRLSSASRAADLPATPFGAVAPLLSGPLGHTLPTSCISVGGAPRAPHACMSSKGRWLCSDYVHSRVPRLRTGCRSCFAISTIVCGSPDGSWESLEVRTVA